MTVSELKEGMLVKVIDNTEYPGHRIGEYGVIYQSDPNSEYPWWVRMDDGECVPWKTCELEAVGIAKKVIEGEVEVFRDEPYNFIEDVVVDNRKFSVKHGFAEYEGKHIRITVEVLDS